MPTISEFKNQMRQGGARSNQFRVTLTFPAYVAGGQAAVTASFLCKAASVPAMTIDNIPVSYRGRPVNFAGERSYAPWNITVINDGDFLVRKAFERWSYGIAHLEDTTGLTNASDYQATLTVDQLDRNDNILKSYTFYDAYPPEIGAMELSYDNPNIQQFDVQFVYNWFETDLV